MKKLFPLALIIAASSHCAFAQNTTNNVNVEASGTVKCRMEGCDLICKGPNSAPYVRADLIKEANVMLLKSGTMVFQLKRYEGDKKIIIPAGTESCEFNHLLD